MSGRGIISSKQVSKGGLSQPKRRIKRNKKNHQRGPIHSLATQEMQNMLLLLLFLPLLLLLLFAVRRSTA
jgi:hypothetical protein